MIYSGGGGILRHPVIKVSLGEAHSRGSDNMWVIAVVPSNSSYLSALNSLRTDLSTDAPSGGVIANR